MGCDGTLNRACASSSLRCIKSRTVNRSIVSVISRSETFVSHLNVGNLDRGLRILAGLVLVALAALDVIGVWGYIGLVLIATGMMAICPLYTLLGVATTSR